MMDLGVDKDEFWNNRLIEAEKNNEQYKAIFNIDIATWDNINQCSKEIFDKIIPISAKVIDVGCGLGDVYSLLPERNYIGIDISNTLLSRCKSKYPDGNFIKCDMRFLPFKDKFYDFCIARGIFAMIKNYLGNEYFEQCLLELMRVSKNVLVIGYKHPSNYLLIQDEKNALNDCYSHIERNGMVG